MIRSSLTMNVHLPISRIPPHNAGKPDMLVPLSTSVVERIPRYTKYLEEDCPYSFDVHTGM